MPYYLLISKSDYQRQEIIFYSSISRQIVNGIALFLKTRVFNVSWEAEKRRTKKF